MRTRDYIVVTVSKNINSFGLYGVIIVAKSGEAWEIGSNALHLPERGKVLHCRVDTGVPCLGELGFEIPTRLADMPENLVTKCWSDAEEVQS